MHGVEEEEVGGSVRAGFVKVFYDVFYLSMALSCNIGNVSVAAR